MTEIPCPQHPDRAATVQLSLYQRPSSLIWRGRGCAECITAARTMISRGNDPTTHLMIFWPLTKERTDVNVAG